MSLILVVESDQSQAGRLAAALQSEGWQVRLASSAAQAEGGPTPDLAIVAADLDGARELFARFSRRRGGPGTIALLSSTSDRSQVPELEAEAVLDLPVREGDLQLTVTRCFAAKAPQEPSSQERFSSLDIFGDVLAEVESEPAQAQPVAPSVAAPRVPAPRAQAPTGDVERQLEQTLSGVLGAEPKTVKPAAPTSRPAPRETSSVDDLLSQTLSGLGVGASKKPAPPKPAAPAPPPLRTEAPAPTAPAPPAPAAPATLPTPAPPVAPAAPDEPTVKISLPVTPSIPPAAAPRPPQAPAAAPPKAAEPPPAAAAAPPATAAPPPSTPSRAPQAPPEALATQKLEVQKPRDKRPTDGPRSFGQYTLLDKIATGGMAEVWKARMLGMEGFQKNVAIKRILPHLTDSSDFLTMFIDEAKLAAQLNHNNIIHIYDLGKIEEDYYIAMEFVDGRDLRSILNSARRKQPTPALPMGLALLVAARLASALDYAHRKKDFDGRELGLVHRDVSPQNVLISYEGDIKLCDFGIVKAVAKASKTQMGALKGKLQYMSPEQAWGRVVDARSDIFSLGAVLFEMLTGRRLFAGESEISVLESVRDCRIESPRSVNPAIPESVDKVVMRALAGEPDDRYQTAGEMQKELERVLYGLDPTPSERDLALYLRSLFDDAPATPLPPAEPAAAAAAAKAAPRPVEMPTAAGVSSSRFDATGADPAHSTSSSKGRYLLIGGIAAALLAAAGLLLFGPKSNKAAPVQEPPTPAVTAPEPPPALPAEAPAPAAEADLQALVQEQVAAQETLLRESLEAEKRALEEQVRKAQAEAERQQAAVAKPEPAKPEPAKPEPSRPEPPKKEPVAAEPLAAQPEPETKPAPAPASSEPARATPEPARPATPPPAATSPAGATKAPAPAPAPAPATKTGDLVALSDPGLTPPKLLDMRKPDYPPMARRLKVQGTVVITVLVDENGMPSQPRVVRGVDQNVGINEAALAAIQTARFAPATKDGVKVKVWYTLSMPFRL